MRKIIVVFLSVALWGCGNTETQQASKTDANEAKTLTGQSGVADDVSQKNVVQVAIGSKDHSTLVKAVQQANLVDALSNAGPFTVFAPVNTAFDNLPEGVLDDLMKPENNSKLADILQYHVSLGVFKPEMLQDGQSLGQANGGNIKITKNGNDIIVNGSAKIVASIPASNGIIHVVDAVLLPGS
jgi:uncharacterized surface protein with fasciclin (FAS1) repeats